MNCQYNIHTYIYVNIYIYLYLAIYTYIYIHTYIYIYIYIYMYLLCSWLIEISFWAACNALLDDDDDVYLIKLQREVLQNLISSRKMQISQICGISKENPHENNKSYRPSDKITKKLHPWKINTNNYLLDWFKSSTTCNWLVIIFCVIFLSVNCNIYIYTYL
jgi:hypothetical protein